MQLHPGQDLEAGEERALQGSGPHPKAAAPWVWWRYNVLYWAATLVLVPLTCAWHRGRLGKAARRLAGTGCPALSCERSHLVCLLSCRRVRA